MRMLAPRLFSSRIFRNSRSVDSKSSAADDSSRMRTLGSVRSARAIVIHCLMLSGRSPTGVSRSRSKPSSSPIKRTCLGDFLLPGEVRAKQIVGTDIQIVEHRAFVGDEHFLVDIGNPERLRLDRRTGGLAEDRYLPAVRNEHARNDLCERALAGAVAADDRVHLALIGAQACAVRARRSGRRSCGLMRFRRSQLPWCRTRGNPTGVSRARLSGAADQAAQVFKACRLPDPRAAGRTDRDRPCLPTSRYRRCTNRRLPRCNPRSTPS